jgi:(S)-ureidoglycine aminohydrolase
MRRASIVALLAATQLVPIKAGVSRWRELVVQQRAGRAERAILLGSTLDLASVELRAVTLQPRRVADSVVIDVRDKEVLLIVKDGQLGIAVKGQQRKVVGAGSVAVALPGDPIVVTNAGDTPATYYLFVYLSKAPPSMQRGLIAGGSFIVDWNVATVKQTATGMRRDIFDRPTAMFARLELHVSTLNEGLTNHAVNSHRAEEFTVMLKGSAEMVIGDPGHGLSVGDVVFLSSNIPQSLKNTGAIPAEYLVIQGL